MSDVGPVLVALGDPTRRTIVAELAAGATPTATELAAALPISRQAVSKHLRVLEDAQVVSAHRQGREARYRLEADALSSASAWIDQLGATWEARLAQLKARAEDDTAIDDRHGP